MAALLVQPKALEMMRLWETFQKCSLPHLVIYLPLLEETQGQLL
jgi:hypothetical protein